jgi:hypothetical protein
MGENICTIRSLDFSYLIYTFTVILSLSLSLLLQSKSTFETNQAVGIIIVLR